MYTVAAITKIIYQLLLLAAAVIVFGLTASLLVLPLYAAVAVWLYLYLSGLKLIAGDKRIIKISGNIFKRKTVYMLKNIKYSSSYILGYSLPGIMKISYRDENVYITGLTGLQITAIEKIISED